MKPLILTALLALAACSAAAQASYPRSYQLETNVWLMANTNHTAVGTNELQLYKARGISLVAHVGSTNTATANLAYSFDLSGDGTNWTTTSPISWTFALASTNGIYWTNIPAPPLDNMKKIRITARTNSHTASVWVTNLQVFITP